MEIIRALIGVALLIGIAWLFSAHKNQVKWYVVLYGILFQFIIILLIFKVPWVKIGFEWMSAGFVKFLGFALKGGEFLYGDLAKNSDANPNARHSLGFLFVFQALPTVIFFSAVTSALYYLGILQKIVFVFAWIMAKTMKLSGAESLSAAGNIFLGQTEAPLLVKPFIGKMTQSELHCLMTGGMSTIAGSVMGAYVTFLGGSSVVEQTQFAAYLLSASIMNAPAAIVMSKLLLPELYSDKIDRSVRVNKESIGVNFIDALARGASDGVKLAINIGGMLLAFIAVIYAINWILVDGIGQWTGLNTWVISQTQGAFDGFSLQYILGQVFRVLAFIMGVDWNESVLVGSLLGQKTVINEFVAYLSLSEMKSSGLLSEKSIVIATYALCGFANFSSIAIQIGGIGSMVPERQNDLSKLGFRALIAASLATMLSATIAGMMV